MLITSGQSCDGLWPNQPAADYEKTLALNIFTVVVVAR